MVSWQQKSSRRIQSELVDIPTSTKQAPNVIQMFCVYWDNWGEKRYPASRHKMLNQCWFKPTLMQRLVSVADWGRQKTCFYRLVVSKRAMRGLLHRLGLGSLPCILYMTCLPCEWYIHVVATTWFDIILTFREYNKSIVLRPFWCWIHILAYYIVAQNSTKKSCKH